MLKDSRHCSAHRAIMLISYLFIYNVKLGKESEKKEKDRASHFGGRDKKRDGSAIPLCDVAVVKHCYKPNLDEH